MKCLKCGYCCHNYCVVIIDKPERGYREDNMIIHESKNGIPTRCKHLLGEVPGEYTCNVPNEVWYKKTPCYQHTQIGNPKADYRIGSFILKKENRAK